MKMIGEKLFEALMGFAMLQLNAFNFCRVSRVA
jgi:hypothetical protein